MALDLSHELDYMRMLFGQPATWLTHEGHSGSLGIASADMFDAVYEFPEGLGVLRPPGLPGSGAQAPDCASWAPTA